MLRLMLRAKEISRLNLLRVRLSRRDYWQGMHWPDSLRALHWLHGSKSLESVSARIALNLSWGHRGQLAQKCHVYPFTSQRNSITAPLRPSMAAVYARPTPMSKSVMEEIVIETTVEPQLTTP